MELEEYKALGRGIRAMILAILGLDETPPDPEPEGAMSGRIIITPEEGEPQEEQNG